MSLTNRLLVIFHFITANLRDAHRFDYLFSLTEVQLGQRGMDRDRLVRSFINGIAYG